MTDRLMISLDLTYARGHGPVVDDEEFFEQVMEHLIELGVEDAGVGLDTGKRRVTITATAEGRDVGEAINAAIASIRTAVHTVGGATPDWPTFADALRFGSVTAVPVSERQDREEDLVG
jgi:hypothetical protein